MCAVAAQPRVGLTPMIPTPSFDGADVIQSSSSARSRTAQDCLIGSISNSRRAFDDASTISAGLRTRQQRLYGGAVARPKTETMRAIVLDAPGPPDALTIRELPVPIL